jgi:hypothetical protein
MSVEPEAAVTMSLFRQVRKVRVSDDVAEGRRFDYADSFELQLPTPDPLSLRRWLGAGLNDSPAIAEKLSALLLRVRDEPTIDPEALADWRVVASTPDLLHIERSLPLLHVVLVGRRLDPSGRRLTTLLTFQRPVLSRLVWTFVGVGHRLLTRRLMCYGIPRTGRVATGTGERRG